LGFAPWETLAKTAFDQAKQTPILETHPVSYRAVTDISMQSKHDFMLHRRSILAGLAAGGACAAAGSAAWAQTVISTAAPTAPIRVAAASDLKFALARLGASFERETGLKLAVTYGSSGNLARQLEQGLPMDLFLSADEALVIRLAKAGWARDEGVVYGRGQLVWLAPKSSSATLNADLKGLAASLGAVGKLSIANPEHAPYGRAARSALQTLGLWEGLQSRLVLGESVTQATQFVSTGAAQAGLVALSLALSPELAALTRYVVVKDQLYPPIIQRMALRKTASLAAQKLYAFLQTDASKAVLRANGLGI
jgi:molybdate transport system substrate-binding protein